MDNLDLDIDNYDLNDLLNLFKLDYNFGKEELKKAKKVVLHMHPDKSKLPKDYFIFFTKAFKIIFSIYEFRCQGDRKRSTKYEVEKDEEKEILLKGISSSKNFNKIFNEMFEKHFRKEEDIEGGYGEWLKEENIEEDKVGNIRDMHSKFEIKKDKARSLVKKEDIQNIQDLDNYKNFLGEQPECYSSGIFASLNYEDLKKAHTETIIPVTNDDYINKKKFNNVHELQEHRNTANIKPLSDKESLEYLNNKQELENKQSVKRAYKLAKQYEETNKINDEWMRGFKQLKDS